MWLDLLLFWVSRFYSKNFWFSLWHGLLLVWDFSGKAADIARRMAKEQHLSQSLVGLTPGAAGTSLPGFAAVDNHSSNP